MSFFTEIQQRIDTALKHTDDTETVLIGNDVLPQTGTVFRRHFGNQTAVLVADVNTWNAAGQKVTAQLQSEGQTQLLPPFIFAEEHFHADDVHLEQLQTFLKTTDAVPIAAGSGTVNDLTKAVSHRCRRSYLVCGTAASMDGYTSFGASIEVNGFKRTLECPAPKAVLIALDVLQTAPAAMNASGYADLYAKIPAGADWILADLIGTEPLHPAAWEMIQNPLRAYLANPDGIVEKDTKALALLAEGLIMSGLAMQLAKTSRTASGAEHLFSHLWDNRHHTFNGTAPSHGEKVGIGTLATSALYEKFLEIPKSYFAEAKEKLPLYYRDWNTVSQYITESFGNTPLAEQVMEQSRQKFISKEEIQRRLTLFGEHWDVLRERIRQQVFPAAKVRDDLRRAGAPHRPEDIGIDAAMYRQSFADAQCIRCRYNILDFTRETGLWNTWFPD
ncbi:MAG: sn-glycerol-1-phosphate dehydrogenase [Planctomycetaceae bacterium]|jgi:glycerol-1-phosphate dehydrogenase [NAD(P)+]|nr:sn-glycerol-1-phosphate dehydrogenase [Planctomycetaceae bacterium]